MVPRRKKAVGKYLIHDAPVQPFGRIGALFVYQKLKIAAFGIGADIAFGKIMLAAHHIKGAERGIYTVFIIEKPAAPFAKLLHGYRNGIRLRRFGKRKAEPLAAVVRKKEHLRAHRRFRDRYPEFDRIRHLECAAYPHRLSIQKLRFQLPRDGA